MKQKPPLVSIIMGSDSDLGVMKEATQILTSFQIEYELTIVSAHRTPHRLYEYAQTVSSRGIHVVIAGAGGAAHLPGMVAALTTIPVIGVPIQSRALSGVDSLYSIVQMPPGVPVATMAINGAQNAGLLAIRILALHDQLLSQKLVMYIKDLADSVTKKAENLES